MGITELSSKLPKALYTHLTSRITELRPCQEKALAAGLLEGKNLLVCSPTASGKTLVAELACLQNILQHKKKAVYIVPLKALAHEKYEEFKKHYGDLGVRIGMSVGDLDATDARLEQYDWIICTSEKLDSLLRHSVSWIHQVGAIVVDEIHLIHDVSRGPTVEVLITMLKQLLPEVQFIGLSATIGNPEELAEWLGAVLVADAWRPVKLYEGICHDGKVDFFGTKEGFSVSEDDALHSIVAQTVKMNKQALVFVNSKRSSEATAEGLSKLFGTTVDPDVTAARNELLHVLSSPTPQCERLAQMMPHGVAFHHSGLASQQQRILEKLFREGKIKIICATTTLAAGIDLPAFRTIVKDLKRYGEDGMGYIPVLEYKQQAGRAGRPRYDSFGEAICFAHSDDEKDYLYENYICGDAEELDSKLAVEPVLRTYLLSLVATGFIQSVQGMIAFFTKTFYAHHFGNVEAIEEQLHELLSRLVSQGFIEQSRDLVIATKLGKRVSQLYIDPETAWDFLQLMEKPYTSDLGMLHALSLVLEMRPAFSLYKKEEEFFQQQLFSHVDDLFMEIPPEYSDEYGDFFSGFKTAFVLSQWANEVTEDELFTKHHVRPGELLAKIDRAKWLLYSFAELGKLAGYTGVTQVEKLRTRITYGIREELLQLVQLKGIGRVRARVLYRNGIKNVLELKKIEYQRLASLLGQKIAKDVKTQLGQQVTEEIVEQKKLS